MVLYALHDSDLDLKKKGSFVVTSSKARELNKHGYGIHWLPNEFKGARKACNLSRIRFYIADIDDGTKSEQMSLILALPIKPSTIVETKNGFHCYWKVKGDAAPENYRIIQTGLIKKLNADPACKDVCRTLRSPGYNHMKDPNDPFMVEVVHSDDRTFTEAQMLYAYKIIEPPRVKKEYTGDKVDFWDESKWEKLFDINNIGEGGRNNNLARIRLWLKDEGFGRQDIHELISRINDKLPNPLDRREINQITRSF